MTAPVPTAPPARRMPALLRGAGALLCALALHAALFVGGVWLLRHAPRTDTLPALDLTSVDLSFSDTPDDTAAPAALPPSAAARARPEPPPPESSPAPLTPSDMPPPSETPVLPPPADPAPQPFRPELPDAPDAPLAPTPSVAAPAAPAPAQARIAADTPPAPRRTIKPDYPKGARQRGEEGDVTLELDVNARGAVDAVRIVSSCGYAELEYAAVEAVRRARFTPARHGRRAVPATARLTLTFRLKD